MEHKKEHPFQNQNENIPYHPLFIKSDIKQETNAMTKWSKKRTILILVQFQIKYVVKCHFSLIFIDFFVIILEI